MSLRSKEPLHRQPAIAEHAEAVAVTAAADANDQLLYFTSSSLTADDRHLVFISDRTGHPNLFTRDLATGCERRLTANAEGTLKSYVYFDGQPYRGFGKASVSLDARRGVVYYIQGRQICAVSLNGEHRVLAEYPADQMTAFTHVSADGTRLCVPTTDARALDGDTRFSGKPGYDIDKRVQEENLSSYLRIYDTATGTEIVSERVPRAWITHVQFSPADPRLILYNHEWSADCGIRRIWLWDGVRHKALRTEGDGRSGQDWVCHEMWERDGSAVIYHGKYANDGPAYVGRLELVSGKLCEIPLAEGMNDYGHFTSGRPGMLVSDGYYRDDTSGNPPQQPGQQGRWISLVNVDWDAGRLEWTPLALSGSSWRGQDEHPHPIIDHAGRHVYFTSDRSGRRAVYRISEKH